MFTRTLRALSLVTLAVVGTLVACSAPETEEAEQGLTNLSEIKKPVLLKKLEFLGSVKAISVVDVDSTEGAGTLGELDRRLAADTEATRWSAAAGDTLAPRVIEVEMADGRTGYVATREWKKESDASRIASALTLVVPPRGLGDTFAYAESHDSKKDAFSEESNLYLLDDAFTKVDHSVLDTKSEASRGAAVVQAFQGQLRLATNSDASADAGSESEPSTECSVCANGLLGVKLVGVAAAYATGTGAATTACALVGIPTAELAGIACHVIVVALSTAAALPLAFDDRAGVCNYVTHDLLGMHPLCRHTDTVTPISILGQ